MRDREEGVPVRGEHGLLLAEVFHPDGQYRSVRRRLSAEPPQVCLAERPFPRERLVRDEPGPVAVPLALGATRELSGQLGHVVKVRHTPYRVQWSGPSVGCRLPGTIANA